MKKLFLLPLFLLLLSAFNAAANKLTVNNRSACAYHFVLYTNGPGSGCTQIKTTVYSIAPFSSIDFVNLGVANWVIEPNCPLSGPNYNAIVFFPTTSTAGSIGGLGPYYSLGTSVTMPSPCGGTNTATWSTAGPDVRVDII